jgi:hypothetical protein
MHLQVAAEQSEADKFRQKVKRVGVHADTGAVKMVYRT